MKILLIEDDADTAAYVADGLREHGHAVDRVADGRDGLSLAADERYELLIVDRMLPGVDGLAIVQTVRARPASRLPSYSSARSAASTIA